MKNKEYLKKYLRVCFIIIIIFSLILFIINQIEYNHYQKNYNYKINAIINLVSSKYEDVNTNEIISILNNNDNSNLILKNYGYDLEHDTLINQNEIINIKYTILKIIIYLIFIILIIYIFIKSHINSDKEINKIIKCIENINHKNYQLDIDSLSEDKLSILKEEIYKTTIMLKEDAENSLKDKINLKKYLQDISHQIKTPVTAINILVDNIIDDKNITKEKEEEFLKQIKREIMNITFLIESLLKLSKFETNSIEYIRKNIKVTDLISKSVTNVSNLCDLKNITISIDNKCKYDLYVDINWQIEALTNIIKNASEHSFDNSTIYIKCFDNNVYTEIKVIDEGSGMSEDDLKNIFKRFYKCKNSSKNSVGIGLSLSKSIIEKDNGKVYAESSLNKGTIFTIKYFR